MPRILTILKCSKSSIRTVSALAIAGTLTMVAQNVPAQDFNDTGDILAHSAEVEDIEYKIMVQRASL